MVFAGSNNDLLVARLGTSDVVLWDLERGVMAHKLTAEEDQRYLGIMTGQNKCVFALFLQHDTKLFVHEYSSKNGNFPLMRKIKSGKWEGPEAAGDETSSMCSAFADGNHIVVQTPTCVRVMESSSGKKTGRIKGKRGNTFARMTSGPNGKVAILQGGGSVIIYELPSCSKSFGEISHALSTANPALQLREDALLIDDTVYSTDAHEKVTKVQSSQPFVVFLTPTQRLLALVYERLHGCKAVWVDIKADDVEPIVKLDERLKAVAKNPSEDTSGKRKQSATTAMMLGPGQVGLEAVPPTKKVKMVDGESSESGKDPEEIAKELSIAERLKQLTSEMEDEDSDHQIIPSTKHSFKPQRATTESLKELLSQALQSGDDSLLELALAVRDLKVIDTTMKELEPSQVVVLLSKLTVRLASSPLRAETLSVWLRHCLKTGRFQGHHLASLRNLLYERVESFSELLRLEGRLSMMCDIE